MIDSYNNMDQLSRVTYGTGGNVRTYGYNSLHEQTAATPVVLAGGAAAAISSLKPGDKVTAVNTATGKTETKTVQADMVKWDTDLYNLNVKVNGHDQTINTTANHLFWVPYLDKFIPASQLKTGAHLQTPGGQVATAVGGTTPTDHDGWMWDLTVQDDHDFYVEPTAAVPQSSAAAEVSVLVHNCGEGEPTSTPIYRTPHASDLDHELASGPNPASHRMEGGDDSVYFGEPSVAADYQGIGDYANGSIRYNMRPAFESEFADVKYRYDWKGPGGTARYEWAIPLSRLARFNELTLNRVWVPAGGGS